MSSGESDYFVVDVSNISTPTNGPLTSISTTSNTRITGTWTGDYKYYQYNTSYPTYWTYWNTVTVYMYQLICPRCGATNWGEVDKVIECKGEIKEGRRSRLCRAKIKAVKETVDYEVPVD